MVGVGGGFFQLLLFFRLDGRCAQQGIAQAHTPSILTTKDRLVRVTGGFPSSVLHTGVDQVSSIMFLCVCSYFPLLEDKSSGELSLAS